MPDHRDQRARLLDAYRDHLLDAGRAARTLVEYRRALTAFWDHCGKQPGRVTPADLRRFLNKPADGPSAKGPWLAETTRAHYAAEVRVFYRWAAAARLLQRDPFAGMPTLKVPPAPPRALELGVIGRLLEVTAAEPRVWLEVWLAYGAGLRVGELASLRVEDVILGAHPHLHVTGKGGRARVVPLASQVVEVLRLVLAGRPATGPLLCQHAHPERGLSRKTVGAELNAALKLVGTDATAHQLRHSFATEILAAGKGQNLRAVAALLGHADLKTTQRYVQAYDQDAYDAAGLLPDPRR